MPTMRFPTLDGDDLIRVENLPPLSLAPETVTALPGSPYEGQEVFFQTAAMKTAKVMWHLRYDSTLSGTAKWLFLGGPPLRVSQNGDHVNNSTTYALFTPDPNLEVTLPVAGIYDVDHGFRGFTGVGAGTNVDIYAQTTGGTGSDNDAAGASITQTASGPIVNAVATRRAGLAAGLVQQYVKQSSGTTHFTYRWMKITPVALGGTT